MPWDTRLDEILPFLAPIPLVGAVLWLVRALFPDFAGEDAELVPAPRKVPGRRGDPAPASDVRSDR